MTVETRIVPFILAPWLQAFLRWLGTVDAPGDGDWQHLTGRDVMDVFKAGWDAAREEEPK